MTKDQKIKNVFANIDDNGLSAGVCGPEGCEIDWDKLAKKNEDKQEKKD